MKRTLISLMLLSTFAMGAEVKSSYQGSIKAVTCTPIHEESSVAGAIVGGGVGAVGGSMVGSMMGGSNGSVIGGLLGGLAGGSVGNSMGSTSTYQCDMLVGNYVDKTEIFFSTITNKVYNVDRGVTVLILMDGTYKVL